MSKTKAEKTDVAMPANTKNRIEFMNNRVDHLEERLKRLLADYDNLEKRHIKQREEYVKYANESLLHNLLPILDDLYRAQEHLNDQGLNMVVGQLNKVLESEGVQKIEPKDQTFDHHIMECIETI